MVAADGELVVLGMGQKRQKLDGGRAGRTAKAWQPADFCTLGSALKDLLWVAFMTAPPAFQVRRCGDGIGKWELYSTQSWQPTRKLRSVLAVMSAGATRPTFFKKDAQVDSAEICEHRWRVTPGHGARHAVWAQNAFVHAFARASLAIRAASRTKPAHLARRLCSTK